MRTYRSSVFSRPNWLAVGCASFDRDYHDDRDFEKRFRPITEAEDPLPLLDAPAPRPQIKRTQTGVLFPPPHDQPEYEIVAVIRRIHESAHLVIGAALGLVTKRVNSRRGTACVEWTVPPGPRAMVSFLTALAASKAAQRKWGAKSFDDHCSDDDRKVDEYAHRVTASASDAQLLIGTINGEVERLVGQYWEQIEWFSRVLERLGDDLDYDLLQKLLPIVKPPQREVIRHRRDGFVSDEVWTRKGLARPRGYDVETREIDAVLSTGAAVRRQDWDGPFDEVLAMGPRNIRMQRLNAGAAILDSHAWDKGLEARLGGVVPGSARIEGGVLLARLKFSRGSPLAQRVVQDLQDGIQIPLSLGYKVHKSEENKRTNPVTRVATDWEPIEVSVVPVGAESETGFRQIAA